MPSDPTADRLRQLTVDDLTLELMAAAANLGMALARFENELKRAKKAKGL